MEKIKSTPECKGCPAGNNRVLGSLACRVRNVHVSEQLELDNFDDEVIHSGTIAPEDIARLESAIQEDIDLSLGCFVALHAEALQDRATLAALDDAQRIAVAGCATRQLQRQCEL